MHISPRHLLVALLLSSPLAAYAQTPPLIDAWLVHQQGERLRNEVFLVDGDPDHIVKRAGGVRSLGVYRVSQDDADRKLTSFDVEVDCAKKRVRIKAADAFSTFTTEFKPVKFSSEWQKSPEPWLAQSRDFLCVPAERDARKMTSWGKMPMPTMIEKGEAYFHVLGREQSIQMILKIIDEAFDKMPQA
jgi:hypothetical protein